MKQFILSIICIFFIGTIFSQAYQFPEYMLVYRSTPKIWNDSTSMCLEYRSERAKICFDYEDKRLTKVRELDLKGKYKFIPKCEAQITKYEYLANGEVSRVEFWENDNERMETNPTFDPIHTATYTYDDLNRVKTMSAWGTLKKDRTVIKDNHFICTVKYEYEGTSERISKLTYLDEKGNLAKSEISTIDFIYDKKMRIMELKITPNGKEQRYPNCASVKYKYKSSKPAMFGQRATSYEVHKYYNAAGKKCDDKTDLISFGTASSENFNHIKYFIQPREWKSVSNPQHQKDTYRSLHTKMGVPPAPWK